jgi:hypothetical protein
MGMSNLEIFVGHYHTDYTFTPRAVIVRYARSSFWPFLQSGQVEQNVIIAKIRILPQYSSGIPSVRAAHRGT